MQEVGVCAPGRRASVSHEVEPDDTAVAMHSGDVAMLATPRALALAEQAAVAALDGCIDPTFTTVGSWAEVDHLAPTPVGRTVTADAVLLGVHGRRLEFSITLTDGEKDVAKVRHRRVIVDRAKFAA
jgi:fluoroacetyl-CoA thioesterase